MKVADSGSASVCSDSGCVGSKCRVDETALLVMLSQAELVPLPLGGNPRSTLNGASPTVSKNGSSAEEPSMVADGGSWRGVVTGEMPTAGATASDCSRGGVPEPASKCGAPTPNGHLTEVDAPPLPVAPLSSMRRTRRRGPPALPATTAPGMDAAAAVTLGGGGGSGEPRWMAGGASVVSRKAAPSLDAGLLDKKSSATTPIAATDIDTGLEEAARPSSDVSDSGRDDAGEGPAAGLASALANRGAVTAGGGGSSPAGAAITRVTDVAGIDGGGGSRTGLPCTYASTPPVVPAVSLPPAVPPARSCAGFAIMTTGASSASSTMCLSLAAATVAEPRPAAAERTGNE